MSQDEQLEEHIIDESSLLFKPLSLVVLFILLLIAIWFKFYTMIGVVSFLCILAIVISIWKRMSIKNIELDIHLSKSRLFVGDEFVVDISVKNNKLLPLVWLELEYENNRLIRWGKDEKQFYIVRLLGLLSYQKTDWKINGKAYERGVYQIGNVIIRSGDGFRFSQIEKHYKSEKMLYIYPQLLRVLVPSFQPTVMWEVRGKQGGLLEDPLTISGIRDYEPGDDWRKFNWWASARSGKMQTNVFQPIILKQIIIYVDVRGFKVNELVYEDEEKQKKYEQRMKDEFEKFLSIIASFTVTYHEQGILIGYRSNGLNHLNKQQPSISPNQDVTTILDQLAQITNDVVDNEPLMIGDVKGSAPIYLFCYEITKENYLAYEQHKKDQIYFYYVKNNVYSEKLQHIAKPINDLLVDVGGE